MMEVSSRFWCVDVIYAPHSDICSKRRLSRLQPIGARGAPYTLVGER